MSTHQDFEYVQKVLKGDTSAYQNLVLTTQDATYTLVVKMIQDDDLAKDLCQEVYIKAYEKLKLYNGQSAFSTWMYQMAYRHTLDYIRKKKLPTTPLQAYHHNFEDDNDADKDCEWVNQALTELTEMDRALLHFYYFEDYSIKQIAAVIEKSESAVKVALKRSRERFKFLSEQRYAEQVSTFKNH